MISNKKYHKKLHELIEKCDERITENENPEKYQEMKEQLQKRLSDMKHIRRAVKGYEDKHHVWFSGTEADVITFDDIVDHCNELLFDEKPVELINTVYIPITMSAIAPYDLRECLFIPKNLLEKDNEWVMP